jgi:hypothetical protein
MLITHKLNMAPHNALTVDEISKVQKEPIFEDIQTTTRLRNANAISVSSMSGGGAHGHLGITMAPVEYAAIFNTPRLGRTTQPRSMKVMQRCLPHQTPQKNNKLRDNITIM